MLDVYLEMNCARCPNKFRIYSAPNKIRLLCDCCLDDIKREDDTIVACEKCNEVHGYQECPYCLSGESKPVPEEKPKPDWILILEKLEDLENLIREEMKKDG